MEPLTEKDISALRKSRGVSLRVFVPAMLFAMCVFHFAMCFVWLRLTVRIGKVGGYTLSDVFRQWIAGIDVAESYSGALVKALERLSLVTVHAGMVLFFLTLGFAAIIQNRRNRRFIDFVEKHEK